jgi:hypothetical protein
MSKSIQEALAEKIKALFPDAQVKKINKDNFLDIHIPSLNPQKSTHLFFNTAKSLIKTGFYCRDKDFIQEVLGRSTTLEAYSQGIRPAGNPEFLAVDDAIASASSMLSNIVNKQDATVVEKPKKAVPRKEKKETKNSKIAEKVDSKEKKTTTNYCFEDPRPFLTAIQCLRNYYLGLSSESPRFRSEYERLLKEFTITSVVPKVSNDIIRITHEEGFAVEALLLKPMFDAEEMYDKEFETHNEYVSALEELVKNVLSFANESLILETIGFLIKLGNILEDEECPLGFLTVQDRYFLVFLIMRSSPNLNLKSLKGVLETIDRAGVDSLLLKASGNFNQLSADEKLALMLYDFILVEEKTGFEVEDRYDMKLYDIATAKRIFTLVTKNSAVDTLIGGFNDNDSFEIFQFFNIYFHRDRFHDFCIDRWKELTAEWNELKLQLIIEAVKRDFHPDTYNLNPVLDSYLEIFGGVKTSNIASTSDKAPKVKQKKEKATIKKSQSENDATQDSSAKVLTLEIAKQLLLEADPFGYLDASSFTAIDDEAAKELVKYKGHVLYLDGLTSLSDKAAEALAKFKNDEIYLTGLTSLSDKASAALATYQGDLTLKEPLASSIKGLQEDKDDFPEIDFKKIVSEEQDTGYPALILSNSEDKAISKLKKEHLNKWQLESEVYANRLGITANIPDWIDGIDRACPKFNKNELELINKIALDHKLIPILSYAPEEFFQEVKRVWWIVPFCIWREDFASWIMVDKNGIYAAYPSDNDISSIYGWDYISDMSFDAGYDDDPNVNTLTIYGLEEGQYLTFSEFVNEEQGSYLRMIYSIYEIRKDTIEASRGNSTWKEGTGGEGFQSFENPNDLLNEKVWLDDPSRPDPRYFA